MLQRVSGLLMRGEPIAEVSGIFVCLFLSRTRVYYSHSVVAGSFDVKSYII